MYIFNVPILCLILLQKVMRNLPLAMNSLWIEIPLKSPQSPQVVLAYLDSSSSYWREKKKKGIEKQAEPGINNMRNFFFSLTKRLSSSFHMKTRPSLEVTVRYTPCFSIWIPEPLKGSWILRKYWKGDYHVILGKALNSLYVYTWDIQFIF